MSQKAEKFQTLLTKPAQSDYEGKHRAKVKENNNLKTKYSRYNQHSLYR